MAAPKSIFRLSAESWKRRRRATAVPLMGVGAAVAAEVRAEVAQAEDLGLLDPQLLDAYEADLVVLIEQTLAKGLGDARDAVGARVAERVFGDRIYTNRLDRQIATGSAAVGEIAAEEALFVVASAVSLRFCGGRYTPAPVWPVQGGDLREVDVAADGSGTTT